MLKFRNGQLLLRGKSVGGGGSLTSNLERNWDNNHYTLFVFTLSMICFVEISELFLYYNLLLIKSDFRGRWSATVEHRG